MIRALPIVMVLAACGSTEDPSTTPDATPEPAKKRIVILMIGDGMGRGHREAASHYAHGEAGKLFMESMPVRGTVITAGPSGTTDSAAAATTMATGRRAFNGAIGVDRDGKPVQTVVELAHDLGLPAGVVATSSLPHATPAAFTAHRSSRHKLSDIAADQVRVVQPDVMLGGGAQYFTGLESHLEARYTVVRTAAGLAAAPKTGRLAGLFAPDHLEFAIARPAATTEPTLPQMSLAALEHLEAASPDGFFVMIEGSRIDMASHGNQLAEAVGETIVFDETIELVSEWARGRDDVTLIVTSDHECGGLEVVTPKGAGVLPDVTWRWGQHTNAPVGVYASGPGTEVLHDTEVTHRTIYQVIESRLRGRPYEPPSAELIPDGRLDDLPLIVATQTNPTGFGPGRNELSALRVAADENGLAVGVEGVFERGKNALVILVDVDYGASTGPARMRGALSDGSGVADGILSSLNLDAPATAGFGVDLAIVSHGAEDPMLEQTIGEGGIRGVRAPYGYSDNLGWYGVAMSFDEEVKAKPSPAPARAVVPGRGFEAHLAWRQLYPDGKPAMPKLAIAAILVNDDGGYTSNQTLPPFPANTPNPARIPVALPGVVVVDISAANAVSARISP